MSDSDVLNAKQTEMNESSETDYSDLKAMFINCTLKRSPELSHTQGLIDISTGSCAPTASRSRRSGRSTTRSRSASGPT